jgi:hypothetical protein
LKEVTHFAIKLNDFCSRRTVDFQAYVEYEVVGQHDIVLGIKFIQQFGLIFDFQRQVVSWDEISIPMRQKETMSPEVLCNIENETPNVLKRAINRGERSITSNFYQDHDYQSMVLKCTHLSKEEQDVTLKLFLNVHLCLMELWERFQT